MCGEVPQVRKAKTKFQYRVGNYRDLILFEQCKTHGRLKERETFWQHRLKAFYPLGLKEKEEYLY